MELIYRLIKGMGFAVNCLFLFLACLSSSHSFAKDNTLRIMSYNIRNGIGMDNMCDYSRTSDLINKYHPNIVAVQEVDSVTGRSNGIDVLNKIAVETRLYPVFAPAIDFDGGKYGIGILCREKPVSYKRYSLPGREETRALLMVEFEKYVYCCTHLSLTEDDRMLSLDVIKDVMKGVSKPLFLAGDLNDHPDSKFIAALCKDFKVLNDTSKFTYPADRPQETLDYILVRKSDGDALLQVSSFVCDEPAASDHRPVVADIIFK